MTANPLVMSTPAAPLVTTSPVTPVASTEATLEGEANPRGTSASGWFRFAATLVECESHSPTMGRVSQRLPLARPIDGFGTHPVVADA